MADLQELAADGDEMPNILKTNLCLTLAISLGLQIDIHDLYAPNNKCVAFPFFPLTLLIELQRRIEDSDTSFRSTIATAHHGGMADGCDLIFVLSMLVHLDHFKPWAVQNWAFRGSHKFSIPDAKSASGLQVKWWSY